MSSFLQTGQILIILKLCKGMQGMTASVCTWQEIFNWNIMTGGQTLEYYWCPVLIFPLTDFMILNNSCKQIRRLLRI